MNYLGTNSGPFCSNLNLYFARNRVILKSRLFTTDDYEFLRKYDGCYRRFIDPEYKSARVLNNFDPNK